MPNLDGLGPAGKQMGMGRGQCQTPKQREPRREACRFENANLTGPSRDTFTPGRNRSENI